MTVYSSALIGADGDDTVEDIKFSNTSDVYCPNSPAHLSVRLEIKTETYFTLYGEAHHLRCKVGAIISEILNTYSDSGTIPSVMECVSSDPSHRLNHRTNEQNCSGHDE